MNSLEARVATFKPPLGTRDVIKVTDVVPLASYSWIEAKIPTIAVPGAILATDSKECSDTPFRSLSQVRLVFGRTPTQDESQQTLVLLSLIKILTAWAGPRLP
jgi:hypothetical protein